MFLEEFTLDTAGMFAPLAVEHCPAPPLPSPGVLLGMGASLFLASDLFPACRARKPGKLSRHSLTVLPGAAGAFHTGDPLDQFDLDVFLGCVTRQLRREKPARQSMRQFLRDIGRRPSPSSMARLEASLLRLARARLELDDTRYGCCFQLLDSVLVDRQWGVFRAKASPEAVDALADPGGLEGLAQFRYGLGSRPLTKWLAGLIWILGVETCLLDLDVLRALCGRQATDLPVFGGKVLAALNTLALSGYVAAVQERPGGNILVSCNQGRTRAAFCRLVR